jgi:two-component system sensor histidine kinase VanS
MQTEIEVALRDKKLTTAVAKDILTSNLEEVARLRQLSDQLLGLTRAEAPLKLAKLNLSNLVTEQMQLFGQRHNLQPTVHAQKDISLKGDDLLLAQVMSIIVDNAVTYSGLPDPAISVDLKEDNNQVILTITNKGKTIAAKDLEHIFDRFYRGKNAAVHNPNGHGLGLALAKDIIARHNGSLEASSTAGTTIFTISLPK